MTTSPRDLEGSRAEGARGAGEPVRTGPPSPGGEESPEARARVRRFGLTLAGVVGGLVLAVVGYVVLFDRVLSDPSLPPTAGTLNPRVLIVELLLLAVVAALATSAVVRSRRGK
jgi:hypothetical protein